MGGRGKDFGAGGGGESAKKQSGLGQAYQPFQGSAPVNRAQRQTAESQLAKINQILGRRK